MDLQTPQPTPALQPHKNFFARHILAEVLGLVIVIAVGVGGYYYQNSKQADTFVPPAHHEQTDPMANWQTYIVRQYGFEVKLPVGWIAEKPDHADLDFASPQAIASKSEYLKAIAEAKGDCCPPYYEYEVSVVNKALEFDEKHDEKSFTNSNGVTFENIIQYGLYAGEYFYTQKNSTYYYFEIIQGTEDQLKQILSTFKFDDTVFCGGIAGFPCPTSGYTCVSNGNYPDAGTTCSVKPTKDTSTNPPSSCIQVLTTARNLTTHEVKDFATPCDVPQGWEIITGTQTK